MKKIKRIKDIKEEKIKLRMKELELEKGIRNNLLELKEQLKPVNFLQKTYKTKLIAIRINNCEFLAVLCLTACQKISIIAGSVRRGGRVVKGDGL